MEIYIEVLYEKSKERFSVGEVGEKNMVLFDFFLYFEEFCIDFFKFI